MKRQMIRLSLALLVVLTTVLAAWVWTSEYDRHPDPEARFKISAVEVKRDRDDRWIHINLKKNGMKDHDFRKPVRLITADGTEHEPADTTFSGTPESGFTEIWYKFWLGAGDLEGPIKLRINDGLLSVKQNQGAPVIEKSDEAVFNSTDWGKSWLGF